MLEHSRINFLRTTVITYLPAFNRAIKQPFAWYNGEIFNSQGESIQIDLTALNQWRHFYSFLYGGTEVSNHESDFLLVQLKLLAIIFGQAVIVYKFANSSFGNNGHFLSDGVQATLLKSLPGLNSTVPENTGSSFRSFLALRITACISGSGVKCPGLETQSFPFSKR